MINTWLDSFKSAWLSKDIPKVLELFADDVEYWETPFKHLDGMASVEDEWGLILSQQEIKLELEPFSSHNDKHVIIWALSYVNAENVATKWKGVYLVQLNQQGLCTYFFQVGEKE